MSDWSLRNGVETVLDTFRKSEASGARSRDRQYAIEILAKYLEMDDQREQAARQLLNEAGELLRIAHHAHQKMGLEGQGDKGLSHEVRMFALHFSRPETPKTPDHTILSGDGRFQEWWSAWKAWARRSRSTDDFR